MIILLVRFHSRSAERNGRNVRHWRVRKRPSFPRVPLLYLWGGKRDGGLEWYVIAGVFSGCFKSNAPHKRRVFDFVDCVLLFLQIVIFHDLLIKIDIAYLARSIVGTVLAGNGFVFAWVWAVTVIAAAVFGTSFRYFFHGFCIFFHDWILQRDL